MLKQPRDIRGKLLRALLWAEMKRGQVYEADVRARSEHIEGCVDGEKVYVNPALPVVEVLLHELLHRAKPRWGEERVLRESRRVLVHMTESEIRRWYRAYQAQSIKRVTKLRLDDDE